MRDAILFSVGLVAFSCAHAAQVTEPYTFVSEYVRSLGAIEHIRANAEEELNDKKSNNFADCVRNSELFQLELRSAVTILKSSNLSGLLHDVPSNLAGFYEQKISLYQQLSDHCSVMLAGPKPNVDYGQIAAAAPKINARLEYIDKSVFEASPLIFAALIDPQPDVHNHLSRLVITKAQRDTLVRTITTIFGQKINQANQNYTVSAAGVIHYYLTKKGYKCSDEP